MQRMREDEAWAQKCLQVALPGVEVRHVDNGKANAIHDFDLVHGGQRCGAVEVTAAADPVSLRLWKAMNGRGDCLVHENLDGGWLVALLPNAWGRRVKSDLPALLAELERREVRCVDDMSVPSRDLLERAQRLGVVSAYQSPKTDHPGSVYYTIELPSERDGGIVAATGDAFARWVGSWLRMPSQADNLVKLRRSGASERHLFLVLPGFTTAPFDAYCPLMINGGSLPTVAPSLPEEITHLWAMSTWDAGDVFFWERSRGWERFQKAM